MYLYSLINEEILRSRKILILTHKKPDGDTLGSSLAFSYYLDKKNIENTIFCVDDPRDKFSFLPNIQKISSDKSVLDFDYDLIISLDVGDLNMLGLNDDHIKIIKNGKLINIDHHKSNSFFGFINLIDIHAASTTVIVFDFFKFINFEFNSVIASLLFSGLYSDTGSFKHSNTDFRAFDIASSLMNSGASISDLNKKLFHNKNISSLKIWAKAFEKAFITDNNVLVSILNKEDFASTGSSPDDLSGLVEYLNMVPGIDYSLLLLDLDGVLKGSLRTKNENIDLSKIAQKLGGGGHNVASGFQLNGCYHLSNYLTILDSNMSKKLFSF